MLIFDIVSRVVHVATAITLVGGSVFTLFVLLPSAKTLSEDVRRDFALAINGRWKRFVHAGIALFLITGFYNYFRAMPDHRGDGLYHGLLGAKMLMAFVVFFFASVLVGRSAKTEGMRVSKAKWLKVIVLLAAIIVSISGYLKIRGIAATAASVSMEVEVL